MKSEYSQIEEDFGVLLVYSETPQAAIDWIVNFTRNSARGGEFYLTNLEEMLKERYYFSSLKTLGDGAAAKPFTEKDRQLVLQTVVETLRKDRKPPRP